MSFFTQILPQFGRNIQREFKSVGAKIERSFKKPVPEWVHDVGELITAVGVGVGVLVFPPLPLISLFAGPIAKKVSATAIHFFGDLGNQAKKVEAEITKLIEILEEIRKLHEKDVVVYKKTKESFDKMAGLINKAQDQLHKLQKKAKKNVDSLQQKLQRYQHMLDDIKERQEELRRLLESAKTVCKEINDVRINQAFAAWERQVHVVVKMAV